MAKLEIYQRDIRLITRFYGAKEGSEWTFSRGRDKWTQEVKNGTEARIKAYCESNRIKCMKGERIYKNT